MEVAAGLEVEPRLGAEDKAGETHGECGAVLNERPAGCKTRKAQTGWDGDSGQVCLARARGREGRVS